MQIRFLFGKTIPCEFDFVLNILFKTEVIGRVLVLIALAGLLNPAIWLFGFPFLETVGILFITHFTVAVLHLSFAVNSVIIVAALKKRSIFEPYLMLAGYIFALPSTYWLLDNWIPGFDPNIVDIIILLGSQFLISQIGLNLILRKILPNSPKQNSAPKGLMSFVLPPVSRVLEIGSHMIPKDKILWIRSQAHNVIIKTTTEQVTVRAALTNIVSNLDDIEGILVHRSTWIAKRAVPSSLSKINDQTITTLDNETHHIAKSKVAIVKKWLNGHVVDVNHNLERDPHSMEIYLPLRPKLRPTPRELFLGIAEVSVLTKIGLVALFILCINPVHWTTSLPLQYWVSYWTAATFSFGIAYPGILVIAVSITKIFKGKYVFEPLVMTAASFFVYLLMLQLGLWLSSYYQEEFLYPIYGVIFNILGIEIAVTILTESELTKIRQKVARQNKNNSAPATSGHIFKITRNRYNTDDIYYIKSEGHYISIVGPSISDFIPGKISEIANEIPTKYGISPHRSYWISQHSIKFATIENRKLILVLKDKTSIAVPRSNTERVKEWLGTVGITIS